MIGDEIEVTVVKVRGCAVQLRIIAPEVPPADQETALYLDESIRIDDRVEVRIVDIRGYKVRLGIAAPSHMVVQREEARR